MKTRNEGILYLNASGLFCCDFSGSAFYYIFSFLEELMQAANSQ
jgi:hypothetical protein